MHYCDHERFVSVKIMLMPDGHMMTIAFAIGVTTRELKEHFANELKVPSGVIHLSLDGKSLDGKSVDTRSQETCLCA